MNDAADTPWMSLAAMPRALGRPQVAGVIRETPEDFQVDEVLGFDPDHEGEHLLLQVRKRNTNTDWLAGRLAAHAGVRRVDVSYAGMKDRYAITTQWFSVRLAGRPGPDWGALQVADVEILQLGRHRRKLRRGALQGNRFRIRIRRLRGDLDSLSSRLARLRDTGMPNYFGEQRFGHDYGNLQQADALFAGRLNKLRRHQRGLYLSAVRSQLFNEVLSRRLQMETWNLPEIGDVLMSEGEGRVSRLDLLDSEILKQTQTLRLHPSGPLWGRGTLPTSGEVRALEEKTLEPFSNWRRGLEQVGLKQARRPLRVGVRGLAWEWLERNQLELRFQLAAGSYATVLLRELIETEGDQRRDLNKT